MTMESLTWKRLGLKRPARERLARERLTFPAAALLAGLVAAAPGAGAATVHTWVDEDGVRHFSDAPPGEAATPSELIEIRHTAPAQRAEDDPNSIVNQWARAREERLERERLNLERREARRAAAQTAAEIAALQREPELDDRNRAPAFVLPYPTRRLGYGLGYGQGYGLGTGIGRPGDPRFGRDGFYRGRVYNRGLGNPRVGQRAGKGGTGQGAKSATARRRTAGFDARTE